MRVVWGRWTDSTHPSKALALPALLLGMLAILSFPAVILAQTDADLTASELLAQARNDVRRLLLEERPLEAKHRIASLQEKYPDDPRLSILLGEAHYALDDLEAAIMSFRQGIARAPAFGGKIFNLGRALQQLGRDQEAIVAFEKMILEKDTGLRSRGLFGRGLSQLALGDRDEAFRSFQESLEVDPTTHRARYRLALILISRGEEEEAIVELERVIAAQPLQHGAIYNLALALGRMGKREESSRNLERYRTVLAGKQHLTSLGERWREDPGNYDLMMRIGLTHRGLGSYREAIEWFEKAARSAPTRGEPALEWARTAIAVGQPDDARRTLARLLAHPDASVVEEARKLLDSIDGTSDSTDREEQE